MNQFNQFPYLQRKNLYPKTEANEPIKYYPNTVLLGKHDGKCDGCGSTPVRVDSYYHFELCKTCDAQDVADEIAAHVFNPNEDLTNEDLTI